ncbi:MAG: (S)-ureidoglycine aminohydrolase [Acidobacteriota bacterium]|nr:(S)-ureidoglycine aminohydrolase [Acidobacteriota bacterium]
MHHLGATRSSLKADHLLQTPDTFIRTPLPGAEGVVFIVHAAPQLGARFTQMTAEFAAGGSLGPAPAQRFIYVIEGNLELNASGRLHVLSAGGYAYLPHDVSHTVRATSASRAVIIEKRYEPQAGAAAPEIIVGDEAAVNPVALMGDNALRVCSLMPDGPAYDFAINTMTYDPGAALSMVEVHVMEHGLLMLEGGGIYRLGDSWYPVQAGDFIWMAPYCPQWFGALGKRPAKYLIYKDWRRHPLKAQAGA